MKNNRFMLVFIGCLIKDSPPPKQEAGYSYCIDDNHLSLSYFLILLADSTTHHKEGCRSSNEQ